MRDAETKKRIILFVAPPGAGKGTVSARACEQYGWLQLSTGDLCRKHIADQTEIGRSMDLIIKSGRLISDSLITSMVKDWFLQKAQGHPAVILDGYPRTQAQVADLREFIDTQLSEYDPMVVQLLVPESDLIDRLLDRQVCSNRECAAVFSTKTGSPLAPRVAGVCDHCGGNLIRRSDDTQDAVIKRLAVYHEHEKALIESYRKAHFPIIILDAGQSPEEVFSDFRVQVGLGRYDSN